MKLIYLLMATILTFSCGSAKNNREKVVILYDWVANSNHTGLYIAQELGYFDDEGLDVAILQAPEDGALELLVAGKAQLAISSQEVLVLAASQGLPIKAVATILQHNDSAFASLASKNIMSPKDFSGKRYLGWGSAIEERIISALMIKDNADPTTTIISLAGGDADLNALLTNHADYIWLFKGWDALAAEQLGYPLNLLMIKDYDERLDYYTPLFVMANNYLLQQPKQAEKIMQAIAKGYRYAAEYPDEAAQIVIAQLPGLNAPLMLASQRYLAPLYLDDNGNFGMMKESVFEAYNSWLIENRLLDYPPKASSLYTNSLLENQ